jgi:tyrosinase
MADQSIRVRRDVYKLEDDTLAWYARTVAAMQKRPLKDPTSWEYQAAIHGLFPNAQDRHNWDQCQHQTWHFLPWHRGYLAYFEQIVQAAITQLGGPSDWALPYWNYSDSSNPQARELPPAFRQEHMDDGSDNPLFVSKRALNGGGSLDAKDVRPDALKEDQFEADPDGGSSGFGGPATGFLHGGGKNGQLENRPHNAVHVALGGGPEGDGLMGNPDTAALDPIFWLHHANIDRLWEIWRTLDPGNVNPTSAAWLTAVPFRLHDADGNPITFTAQQMLDTKSAPPLSYRYDSLDDPRGPAPTPPVDQFQPSERVQLMADRESIPEMVGATEEPLEIGRTARSTSFPVERPTGPTTMAVEADFAREPAVYLNLENIVGTKATINYDVYVNVPEGEDPAEHEEDFAGVLAPFGIERASASEDEHGGSGLHVVFEITDIVRRQVGEGVWDPNALRVTVAPRRTDREPPPITIGRISLYYKR